MWRVTTTTTKRCSAVSGVSPAHLVAVLELHFTRVARDCGHLDPLRTFQHACFARARLHADHAHGNELVRGERAGLVEEAVVHFAGVRHPVGLGAENAAPGQVEQRRVHRHGHLHRQLLWHNRRDDDHAFEQQLVRGAVALLDTFFQHVPRGNLGTSHGGEVCVCARGGGGLVLIYV